jgi:RsiW-degrading membrane proteinase PrsW (M82 family)/Mor family transcriptional regulator
MLNDQYIYLIFASLSAICGGMLWVGYFRKIDVLEKERYIDIASALLTGYLTPTVALYVYAWMESLGFNFNGEFANDFIYAIFGVGATEELSKLLGVLVVFQILKKRINEPVDYLVFAGLVALGFSIRENFIYYNNYGSQIASGRTIISCLVHIINTSICVYGIYRYRIFNKGNPLFNATLAISLAIVSHGLFDFFLTQPFLGNLTPLLSTIIYLVGINIWLQMINNAISFSPYFNYQKITSSASLYTTIFIWYFVVLAISICFTSYFKTFPEALEEAFRNAGQEGFVLVTLALRASRLSINKNKYVPVKLQFPIYRTTNDDADFSVFGLNLKIRGENPKEMRFLKYVGRDILLCSLKAKDSVVQGNRKAHIIKKYFLKNDVITYLVKVEEENNGESFYLLKPKTLANTLYDNKYPIAKLMLYSNDDIESYKQKKTDYHQLEFLEEVYLKELT